MSLITKIFGTHSQHELKRVYPIVDKIEALRPAMMELSDEQLREKTREYKERFKNGETLDDLLVEAFATVREAARRVLGMEHYRWAALSFIRDESRRCVPVKERLWCLRFRLI